MQIERHTVVPGEPARAFALVDDLAAYPAWMDLIHEVVPAESATAEPAWEVELQAQVGPFARSKRLRMVRVVHEPPERVVFERAEIDGRRHSSWVLSATLAPVGGAESSTSITMTLTYGGNLWTGAVLQRVLDDHVERGAAALQRLLSAPDT
jgi:Polyketide cyclase / dehydrase and lipid transport